MLKQVRVIYPPYDHIKYLYVNRNATKKIMKHILKTATTVKIMRKIWRLEVVKLKNHI